ncbi:MAG: hypothetical protein IH948_07310 [Bacteroidetes bacterium]|nr:hypothetical protein [Bacteroidota bacterium]
MKKIIVFFFLLILPIFVSAQIVNIPDPIFKAALVGNTAINTNGDGKLKNESVTNKEIDYYFERMAL